MIYKTKIFTKKLILKNDNYIKNIMPNYCTNTLVVSGKDLELFKNEVKGTDGEFSLDSLIPIPNFKNLSFVVFGFLETLAIWKLGLCCVVYNYILVDGKRL